MLRAGNPCQVNIYKHSCSLGNTSTTADSLSCCPPPPRPLPSPKLLQPREPPGDRE